MMRSLYSGVSGLQNHQTRMDVIGNNISNVNTTGFKRGRVNFQDMISQQLAGAAKPTDELGGVNPKDIGLGMTISTIEQVFTQGNLQTTGVSTDVAIRGNGFFIVKNGDESFYTRNGVFGLDRDGTLVNPANGMRVQGWMARDFNGEQVVQTAATPTDLVIPVGSKDPAHATENVLFACNLNKNTPEILEGASAADIAKGTCATEQKIYDSFGNEHLLSVSFQRVAGNPNAWEATVNVDADNADFTQTRIGLDANDGAGNTFIVEFDNMGRLASVTDSMGVPSAAEGEIVLSASYTVPEAEADEDGNPMRHSFNINLGTIGSMRNTITQSASKSSTKAYSQDGYTLGYLDNFKIDSSGTITGVYSNGTNRVIGQIALATFANDRGLEKAGDNTYIETNNSGQASIG
ncbi:MAG: flagellar hook protein FlgE, partial [Treponemataceae bacterium]|nr:flagellar hook protein FlgE [Treponemataceae bacterium]